MGFKLLKQENDQMGHTHFRFQQTFNGTPLEDAIWIAHTIDGRVYSCNGLIYKTLRVNPATNLNEAGALQKALDKIGAETYKWQMPGEEAHLKLESGDQTATYFPKGELVYVASGNKFEASSYRLAYKFNIYAHKPLYRANVYVDINTGEIIRENLLIHHADTQELRTLFIVAHKQLLPIVLKVRTVCVMRVEGMDSHLRFEQR